MKAKGIKAAAVKGSGGGGRGEKKIITDKIKEKFKNVVLGDLTTTQLMELNQKTPLNMVWKFRDGKKNLRNQIEKWPKL